MEEHHSNTAKLWKRIGLIVLCVILFLFLLFSIGITIYAHHLLGLINRYPEEDPNASGQEQIEIPTWEEETLPPDYTGPTLDDSDVTFDTAPNEAVKQEGIINIMLVGQDRRPNEHGRTRSDAMILCTFNLKQKTVTMTSFLRDMYVHIPGHPSNRINASYAFGGMPLLKETVAVNFGVHIDSCVEVDFAGFEKVIDLVDGVDINLTEKEANHLNGNRGWSLKPGVNHLDGAKALEYARIRHLDSDFGRTERQRKVLTALAAKCRNMSWSQVLSIIEEVLPIITTDMSDSEIIRNATQLFPLLSSADIRTQYIPAKGTYKSAYVGKKAVLLPDFAANRQILINTLMGK